MSDRDEVERAARALLDEVERMFVAPYGEGILFHREFKALKAALAHAARGEGEGHKAYRWTDVRTDDVRVTRDRPVNYAANGVVLEFPYDGPELPECAEIYVPLDHDVRPTTPAPAAPKCGACGGTRGEHLTVMRDMGHSHFMAERCRDPFHAAPPRPVTPDDSAGGERQRFLAWWYGDSSTDYAAFPGENTKCVAYAAWCGRARALRDERGGHDEPDPRGEDRDAIEAARRGGGRGE